MLDELVVTQGADEVNSRTFGIFALRAVFPANFVTPATEANTRWCECRRIADFMVRNNTWRSSAVVQTMTHAQRAHHRKNPAMKCNSANTSRTMSRSVAASKPQPARHDRTAGTTLALYGNCAHQSCVTRLGVTKQNAWIARHPSGRRMSRAKTESCVFNWGSPRLP